MCAYGRQMIVKIAQIRLGKFSVCAGKVPNFGKNVPAPLDRNKML